MPKFTRVIHVGSKFKFGKLRELAPDANVQFRNPDGTVSDEEPMGLVLYDEAEREGHIYALNDKTRQELVASLCGGVVPATLVEQSKIIRAGEIRH